MADSLEARVRRLEDLESIRKLKYVYCNLCDDGYPPDALAALFTEDAVWDGGLLGKAEGNAQIRRFFAACSKTVSFAVHHVINPILEVEGDTATGLWLLWQPVVFARADRAAWLVARYHDRYVRVGAEWRFAHVRVETRALSPYEDGFAKVRIGEFV